MSIIGLGTDIVAVARIADLLSGHGDRFLQRCFSPVERAYFTGRHDSGLWTAVAGRWAAKESFLKALGGRIAHIPYHEISVEHLAGGGPRIVAGGQAAAALQERGAKRVHVTISHERQFATATVVLE